MLFQGTDVLGVESGEITVAYRRWAEARVVPGRVYRTNAGRIEIDAISQVNPDLIVDADITGTGRENARDIRRRLRGDESLPTWRIAFHLVEGPDPREELANTTTFSADDLADLQSRLDGLDARSAHGPWTLAYLRLIEAKPNVKAAVLAEEVGRDLLPFKTDIRKLKNLGLTFSLEKGYTLTPRGNSYLKTLT
ncbi:hypothetical protein OG394_16695 [Kribbella sp. NBC_01245]|uniref:hypothetical protein n=1 Tax=Kribbella sp. NBC_01245 TaxID=2903578 RepID=UPI002E27D735|nr:hypothetical protein [Kribbella sp. NBC_01245]